MYVCPDECVMLAMKTPFGAISVGTQHDRDRRPRPEGDTNLRYNAYAAGS
jgi:hypothetical protein